MEYLSTVIFLGSLNLDMIKATDVQVSGHSHLVVYRFLTTIFWNILAFQGLSFLYSSPTLQMSFGADMVFIQIPIGYALSNSDMI